jgi:hypothetical protein
MKQKTLTDRFTDANRKNHRGVLQSNFAKVCTMRPEYVDFDMYFGAHSTKVNKRSGIPFRVLAPG